RPAGGIPRRDPSPPRRECMAIDVGRCRGVGEAGSTEEVPRHGKGFRRMSADRLRPLTNDAWGVPANCFVCGPRNGAGLRIRFHHDTVDEVVVADFVLDERFSGAPRFVHGGVVLAVLDEAMAWATIALVRRFAVTVETTTRFERPVKIGR